MLWSHRVRPTTLAPSSSINQALATPTFGTNAARLKVSRRHQFNLIGIKTPVIVLELTPVVFRLVWVIVVATHLLCIGFLVSTAMTYWYFTSRFMRYFVRLWCPVAGNRDYAKYAVTFSLVGTIHATQVGKLLYFSLLARQLVFQRVSGGSARGQHTNDENPKILDQALLSFNKLTRLKSVIYQARRVWDALFSSRGVFGVGSKYFRALFVLREVVKVFFQTYQAYQSSLLLPREWLNTLLVALLVANCWSTLAVG